MTEVLAPTVAEFAPADARPAMEIPKLLRGDDHVVPGFLRARHRERPRRRLSCRATRRRRPLGGQRAEAVDEPGAVRDACVLLTRTGPPGSAHRGITAFFVDMDTPGITVRPFELINGAPEFAEVFFDDVVVPADRILGEVNGGWAVAMNILPFERSTSLLAPHRVPRQPDATAGRARRPTTCTARRCSARRSNSCTRCARAHGSRSTGSPSRAPRVRRRRSTRSWSPRPSSSSSTRSRELAARRRGARRQPRRRAVALRVPVLARGDHLRRYRPRSSATSWPDGCSISDRRCRLDADELELLDKSVRHALTSDADADDAPRGASGGPTCSLPNRATRCRWCSAPSATSMPSRRRSTT